MISIAMGSRCTIENVQEIKDYILKALDEAEDIIEVDISRVEAVDAAGIQFFVAGVKEAVKRKITVKLKGPMQPQVEEVFRLTGVHYDDTFPVDGN